MRSTLKRVFPRREWPHRIVTRKQANATWLSACRAPSMSGSLRPRQPPALPASAQPDGKLRFGVLADGRCRRREVGGDPTREVWTPERGSSQAPAGYWRACLDCSSIIPLLFLYCFSIVSLLFLYCFSIAGRFFHFQPLGLRPMMPCRFWLLQTTQA
jgi:hypothetical protein